MAEKGVMLTRDGARRTAETNRRVLGRRLPFDQLKRRQSIGGGDGITTTGGGGNPHACDCCDCLDCKDLCDDDVKESDVVLDCSNCPNGALKTIAVSVGLYEAFPGIGDTTVDGVRLTYVSECTWESTNQTVTSSDAVYKWVLTQAKSGSTLQLVHVSGSDPIGLDGGYFQVVYKATVGNDNDWSCLCAAQLKISQPDRVKKPAGLRCSVCLIPKTTIELTGACELTIDGVSFAPCIFVEFPGGIGDLFGICPWAGSTEVSGELGPDLEDPVNYPCARTYNFTVDGGFISVTWLNATTVRIRATMTDCDGDTKTSERTYSRNITTDPLVLGANTYTLDPLPPTVIDPTVWPDSTPITITDCRFSQSHPDYGYGCGGGHAADCDDTCSWLGVDDGMGGAMWSANGYTGIDGCVNCGGCLEPDTPASLGATATTHCASAP